MSSCQYCGRILKQKALRNHILTRHHIGSLSEDPQLPEEPPMKKIKIEPESDEFERKFKPQIKIEPKFFELEDKFESEIKPNFTDDVVFKKPFTPPPKKKIVRRRTCDEKPQIVSGKIMSHMKRYQSLDKLSCCQSETKLMIKLRRCSKDSWAIVSP